VDILQAIGNTSMVQLRKVVTSSGCADVLVKLEWENPTGSMKDRMAQAVISRPEQDGRLHPGDTIVEYTGGSTGASLALVCAAKGYRIQIVTSDAFSQDKLVQMAALGAELTLVSSEGGLTTKKLILDMIETARRLSRQPHTYWTDQLNNQDSIAGYYALGEEIWSQTGGAIDAFVHCVGTAASSRGVATVLKRRKPTIKVVVVEPAESSVLLGGQAGPHKIEGVGIGYTPPLWDPTLVDEIMRVATDDAKAMARRRHRDAESLRREISRGARSGYLLGCRLRGSGGPVHFGSGPCHRHRFGHGGQWNRDLSNHNPDCLRRWWDTGGGSDRFCGSLCRQPGDGLGSLRRQQRQIALPVHRAGSRSYTGPGRHVVRVCPGPGLGGPPVR